MFTALRVGAFGMLTVLTAVRVRVVFAAVGHGKPPLEIYQ
jgi:hypothetical protein